MKENNTKQGKEKKMKPQLTTWQERLNSLSDESLREALKKREQYIKDKAIPIVIVDGVKYRCTEWKSAVKYNIYLESLQEGQDDWVQVEDLTELRVWEYNKLVDELNKHYPDYPIEYLEGRFV